MGDRTRGLKPPISSHEEAAELGRRGGIASGKTRRKKATIKACMKMLVNKEMSPDKLKELGLDENTTYGMAMAVKWIETSLNGNPQMARLVAEMLGENKTEIDINGALPVVIHDVVTE